MKIPIELEGESALDSETLAPSATVEDPTTLRCSAHDFSDPAGERVDTDYFASGDQVHIVSPDFAAIRGTARVVAAVPGDRCVHVDEIPAGVQAGDFIVLFSRGA